MIAIDIGNSKTHVGFVTAGKVTRTWKLATNKSLLADEYIAQWNLFLSTIDRRFEDLPCCIASVVPHVTEQIRLKIKDRTDVHLVHWQSPVEFEIQLPRPQTLGADLIAAAQGALLKFSPPLIIIDAGTATTVTVINRKRQFIGGSISPGLGISAQALFQSAAALSPVELQLPEKAIGDHTQQAVLSGVCLGHALMVEKMVERFESELGERCTVVATGGAIERIASALPERFIIEPHLTLEGLVHIHTLVSRQS